MVGSSLTRRVIIVGYFASEKKACFIRRIIKELTEQGIEAVVVSNDANEQFKELRIQEYWLPAWFFRGIPLSRKFALTCRHVLHEVKQRPRTAIEAFLMDLKYASQFPQYGGRISILKRSVAGYDTFLGRLWRSVRLGHNDAVIVFGTHQPGHQTLLSICRHMNIPFCSMENGIFGGTIHFSPQCVTSGLYAMVERDRFNVIPVSEQQLETAKQYLIEAAAERFEQKAQPCNLELQNWFKKEKRRIILVPGCGILGGGFYPYFRRSRKRVSPHFRNNLALVYEVAHAAQKLDCMVVYKQHPNSLFELEKHKLPDNVILVGESNVAEIVKQVDLVVSLGTKVACTALVHGTPVLMAGEFTLKGTGSCIDYCPHTPFVDQLRKALESGFTQKHKDAFEYYVARELANVAFQFEDGTIGRYGRSQAEIPELLTSYLGLKGKPFSPSYHHPLFCACETC